MFEEMDKAFDQFKKECEEVIEKLKESQKIAENTAKKMEELKKQLNKRVQ